MRRVVILVLLGVVAAATFIGLNLWQAWAAVERIPLDSDGARSRLTYAAAARGDGAGTAVLLVGVDRSPLQDYVRADAIHVLFADRNQVTSLPRDLVITDPCTGEQSTLSRQYTECGVTPEERLTVAVEDVIGTTIDAYVEFDYGNFAALINEIGGIEICVENPLRGWEGGRTLLAAGCSAVGGGTALWWSRHRLIQERVNGEWRPFPGVGDQQRIDHRHEILEQVLGELADYRPWDPDLNGITQHLRMSAMSIIDGMRLVGDLRGIDFGSLRMKRVDGEVVITDDGMYGIVVK